MITEQLKQYQNISSKQDPVMNIECECVCTDWDKCICCSDNLILPSKREKKNKKYHSEYLETEFHWTGYALPVPFLLGNLVK